MKKEINKEGFRLVMNCVKFRRECKKLPPLVVPDYIKEAARKAGFDWQEEKERRKL